MSAPETTRGSGEPTPPTVRLDGKEAQNVAMALKSLLLIAGGIDNGFCQVCGGHRLYNLRGKPQTCPSELCPTPEWDAALKTIRAAIAAARAQVEEGR